MSELIGLRISNARKQKNMSQKELAEGIISRSYLSNIEKGNKFPATETLKFLYERLDISLETLTLHSQPKEQLMKLFEKIFVALVLDKFIQAKSLLDKIKSQHDLNKELPSIEISYYLLLSTYYHKNWLYEKAAYIDATYLSNIEKVIPCRKLNHTIQKYYFLHQIQKAFHHDDFEHSIHSVNQIVHFTHSDKQINIHLASQKVIHYIYLSRYEPALESLKKIQEATMQLPMHQQDICVKLYFLEGFIYQDIGFYQQSNQAFEKALKMAERHPHMKDHFWLLIRYQQAQLLQKGNPNLDITDKLNAIYFSIQEKVEKKQLFSQNEQLPIAELMVLYAENQDIERTKFLLELLEQLKYHDRKIIQFIKYSRALIALSHNNCEMYEKKITQVLDMLGESDNPKLIARIKKQASEYYSKKKMYKKSYRILTDINK